MSESIHIFWFRRDLRLEDNAGLFHALNSEEKVLPIFIFDKNILEKLEDKSDRRLDFIHQNLEILNEKLILLGSSLLVIHATPLEAFKKIIKEYKVIRVYTNHDYETYAIERDDKIKDFLNLNGIEFHSFKDQVIFEKDEVLKSDGKPYTIFTPFSRIWKEKISREPIKNYPSEKNLRNLFKFPTTKIPSLKELGFEKTDIIIPSIVPDASIIQHYHETRNNPGIEGSSRMGVHLRFGTISIRKLVQKAISLNETYLNELIWREFFMCILFHFPKVVDHSFKSKYDRILWRNNENEFKLWCEGKTGYPIVDAGMRQLNETGWMHNRVRMITASFLCKHLLIDWRWGEQYFSKKLLDYELSSNNGNWQWAAGCGCDAAPYFRIFNPEAQTKKFDPDYIYIKRWVKEFNTKEYPIPMVDHQLSRERVLKVYKNALID